MLLKSTKAYHKLPCAHRQFFDKAIDGTPGPCAKFHGYDRSILFEFTGKPDENGWVVGFGDLKPLKKFLEYYFDHTTLVGANDPDLKDMLTKDYLNIRALPYGCSMEMSSLFIWERVNTFIHDLTKGRTVVTRVESREHDSNSGIIEFDYKEAKEYALMWRKVLSEPLVEHPIWNFTKPSSLNFNWNE